VIASSILMAIGISPGLSAIVAVIHLIKEVLS